MSRGLTSDDGDPDDVEPVELAPLHKTRLGLRSGARPPIGPSATGVTLHAVTKSVILAK
jgi:hypothetical protein